MFGLKTKVGPCDLHSMVLSFCLIFLRSCDNCDLYFLHGLVIFAKYLQGRGMYEHDAMGIKSVLPIFYLE